MFLSIIILPLLGSIVAGFFGRKVGVSGAQFVTCLCVITTTILAVLAFFEVGFNNSPVSIELFRWIDSEWFNITWGFEFDSLTVSMLLPVLIISSLVHIYSISYMSNDPHIQRFFSYLSLFTFMMIILVTGNNYLLMFVGWEGSPTTCPKRLSQLDDSILKAKFFMHNCNQKRFFFSKNFKSISLLSSKRGLSPFVGIRSYITKKLDNLEKIYPHFITGFVDAEGCFMISIYRRAENKTGWQIKPEFKITLHSKDLHLLEKIQSYFGAFRNPPQPLSLLKREREGLGDNRLGQASPVLGRRVGRIIKKDKRVSFEVKSLKDISEIIIPHFDIYPLISQKSADFILFKSWPLRGKVESILRKEHFTEEGLIKIVGIRSTLNLGLTPVLKEAFPKVIPVNRPLVKLAETIDPNWLTGFISGEGCFFISISKDVTKRTGFSVNSWFILGQHSLIPATQGYDKELIVKLKDYLSCGNLRIEKSMVLLRVSKFLDITDKIIPFLDKHPVQGIKYLDYLDFKRVVELIKSKAHITPEGLAEIRNIKEKMNTGRDFIKFLPEESSIEGLTKEPESSSALVSNVLGKQRNTLGGITQKRSFWSNRLKSHERIGPHNLDVISLIVGSLLSNSYLEKRKSGLGIRIVFIKCSNNVEYLMWFHSVLSDNGYCSNKKPKLYKIIGKGNKVLFTYSIKSYSFSSFTWLFNMFYRYNIKIIPRNLDKYLTPLALATLFLSSPWGKNSKLATTWISAEDLEYLSLILKNKYNIETIIKFNNKCLNSGMYSSGSLYIKNTSFSTFSKVVKPHLLHSQHYLLNTPVLKLNIPRGQCIQNYSYLSSSMPGDKRGFSIPLGYAKP